MAFAGQMDTLADFGLTARAKHVATPEEKIASAAKAKATRAARHTMGSKQKAAIKGTVTPTAPTTAASPCSDAQPDAAGGSADDAGRDRRRPRRRRRSRRTPRSEVTEGVVA